MCSQQFLSHLILLVFLHISPYIFSCQKTPADVDRTLLKAEPSHYQRQLQLIKLFNNLNCLRDADKDLHDISNTFNPLENLELYKTPSLVKEYFESVQQGTGLRRDEPFANDANTIAQLKALFLIHLEIDDWDLFYKTAAYSSARVNVSLFFWALSTLISSKFAHEHFRTPPSYEVFPQLFTPKEILYALNGLDNIPSSNFTNGEEDQLNYYRLDPQINSFHLAWHVDFPFWWRYEDYGIEKDRKGELFLYMHHQMLNRFRAERLSVPGLKDPEPLKLNEEIELGYDAATLNVNFEQFPVRLNHSRLLDLPTLTVESVLLQERKFYEDVTQGYLLNDSGEKLPINKDASYDLVGATAEASEQSVSQNLYGSLHNRLHRMIARIPDPNGTLMLPPGVISHSETAVQDPVFFRIHSLIDIFYTRQSENLKPYSAKDLEFHCVDLFSVRIVKEGDSMPPGEIWPFEPPPSVLETFFEEFSYEVSNGIMSCSAVNSDMNFTATIRRLNHKPFKYMIKVNSHKLINSTVRIFMSPVIDYDGRPYSQRDLHKNMFEMDKFTVTLTKGQNIIQRSSRDSSVIIPDPTGTKELIKETEMAISQGKTSHLFKASKYKDRHCGYPEHMLVPKGTPQGMRFKLFVILTEAQELNESPAVSVCGVQTGTYPDRKPMGFPFDRKINFGLSLPWFIHQNYKFIEVIVKHKTNKS